MNRTIINETENYTAFMLNGEYYIEGHGIELLILSPSGSEEHEIMADSFAVDADDESLRVCFMEYYIGELEGIFCGFDGHVRVHYEGDDTEPKAYSSFEDALEEVAGQGIKNGYSPTQMEGITYIVSEAEYQAEVAEYQSQHVDDFLIPDSVV
ncbi:MAG: hypothetical protein HQM11_07815 [SAR324 cluster bacterium]|nr:hypothetical protein [SAR324 cluster bacterium]